jgi:hypothetical protein
MICDDFIITCLLGGLPGAVRAMAAADATFLYMK